MERRGVLVRSSIPDHIRGRITMLEPIFSPAAYSILIEGSDGIGRKVESPWVRICDQFMPPSATTGWYVVLHFSCNGSDMFITVGCGSTALRQGSLVPLPAEDLERKVSWARNIAENKGFPVSRFQDAIDAQGNDLSRQFERATAFAKLYRDDSFSESEFWDDTTSLCKVLVCLYDEERLGKAPYSDQPELHSGQLEIEQAISGRTKGHNGQGALSLGCGAFGY